MIRSQQYCDICELELGEGHKDAQIIKPPKCPAFPQLIWTYYKMGVSIWKRPDNKPIMTDGWQGGPNQLEFCQKHAQEFNTLLKYFCKRDSRITKIVDKLCEEDKVNWDKKQDDKKSEFSRLLNQWEKEKTNAVDGD